MDELGSALQTWEEMVSRYNKKSLKLGEPAIADDFLCSALEALVPDDLEKHLQLNASRLKKYNDMRQEVMTYYETRTGKLVKVTLRDRMPQHGQQKFEGYCDNCGKYGHKKKGGLDMGAIEIAAVSTTDGSEYVRFNLDSGAAATAYPREWFAGSSAPIPSPNHSGYITASGERIQDYGGVRLHCKDENDARRCITGRRSDVRKILASASQVCEKGRQLIWLSADGGYVIPKDGRIGKMLQKELDRLVRRFGDDSLLPVYRERGVYNFYMKVERAEDIAPLGLSPVDEHYGMGHAQFRYWCRHCQAARGIGEQHRARQEDPETADPVVCSDYGYLADDGSEDTALPMLVIRDRRTKGYAATAVPQKGVHPYPVKFFAGYLKELGWKRYVSRSDGERSLVALKQAVADQMQAVETVMQESPVGDHAANGEAENAVKEVKRIVRAQKETFEERRATHAAGGSTGAATARRRAASRKVQRKRVAPLRLRRQGLEARLQRQGPVLRLRRYQAPRLREVDLSAEELEDITHLGLQLGAVDVREECPPPCPVALSCHLGLRPGVSADMQAERPNGGHWDFRKEEDRKEWYDTLEREDPYILIGSPPSTALAELQGASRLRRDPEKALQEQDLAERHLEVACESYRRQMARGRYFVHEHPHEDSSWDSTVVQELLGQNAVERVRGAVCKWSAKPAGQGEPPSGVQGFIRRRAGFMTNMPELALELKKGCSDDAGPEQHRHVPLTGGLARRAQVHPPMLARCVLRAVKESMKKDGSLSGLAERDYTAVLKQDGHEAGRANPALFYRKVDDCRSLVHGDDFCAMGDDDALDQIEHTLRKKYDLKVTGSFELGSGEEQEVVFLNRILRVTGSPGEERFEVEADPRHAEMIVRDMGLEKESAKTLDVPGLKKEEAETEERLASPPLVGDDIRLYRSVTMRASYLAPDRADIGDAVKNLAKHMQSPKQVDMARLKRLARYLKGRPWVVQVLRRNKHIDRGSPLPILVMVDSDNAGDKISRRSTVGQVVFVGGQVVKHACNLLQVVGLSSGENEYYAISAGACTGLGIQGLLEDWQVPSKVKVVSDSSAARGFASRRGVGKLKHVQTRYLWVQERIVMQHLELGKIGTAENRSDLLTKPLGRKEIDVHMKGINQEYRSGRPAKGLLLK
ncbi:unnamed protein product [Prorocentrum cordatum]|uniref:Uncharacterized protein n=1 Tax=Prorocentrum cordatum TaxID=2364126 RepID=A0ABN9SDN1_9DINO|nr:unnamed protein product [Polarella glacialis]